MTQLVHTPQVSLSGRQKAAVLLIALGSELSAQVLRHLGEEDIEQLTLELAAQRHVTPDVQEQVLSEFYDICLAQEYIRTGGIDYARDVLNRSLGAERAAEILDRLTASLQVRPFDFARRTDPSQLLSFIQNEHPQVIALVMAYLQPDQAAVLLSALPPDAQAEVARRLAIMDRTSPEVLREVERVLERKVASLGGQDYTAAGGLESVVEVLNRVDRGTEKTIMEALAVQDPVLTEEIKKRMFLFEDLVFLDNRSLQRVLREVDMGRDLPLALKGASEEVKRKVYQNISKRAQEILKEAMEYLGPVRLRDVEEAQAKVVAVVRRLEDEGEIVNARGGGEDIVV